MKLSERKMEEIVERLKREVEESITNIDIKDCKELLEWLLADIQELRDSFGK